MTVTIKTETNGNISVSLEVNRYDVYYAKVYKKRNSYWYEISSSQYYKDKTKAEAAYKRFVKKYIYIKDIEEKDMGEEKNILCGFIYCHAKKDFSSWEVNISKEDQESIEKILEKYSTEGFSVRNVWDSNFNELFSEEY